MTTPRKPQPAPFLGHLSYPTTLPEFQEQFGTEEACFEYMARVRWPDGFLCPHVDKKEQIQCNAPLGAFLKTNNLFECKNGHQTSITSGTMMHRTKQPLRTWFYGAWLVCTLTPGISGVQFQRQLGLSRYETAWNLLHKIRASIFTYQRSKLQGEIELDETLIGGREHGTGTGGRGTKTKSIVMIAVEFERYRDKANRNMVKAGRVRLQVVEDYTAVQLVGFVVKNVERGTTVYSDGNASYNALEALHYNHLPNVRADLPVLHRVISNLKGWLQGTHRGAVRRKHLQAYLTEFTFRFNRRRNPWATFNRSLGLIAHTTQPPEYEQLYKGEWRHPNRSPNPNSDRAMDRVDLGAFDAELEMVLVKDAVEKAEKVERARLRKEAKKSENSE